MSPSHFSNIFKRHFSMSPKDARDAAATNHPKGMAYNFHAPEVQTLNDAELMHFWAKTLKTNAANL